MIKTKGIVFSDNFTDAVITGWTTPTPGLSTPTGHIEIAVITAENSVAVGTAIFTAAATTNESSVTYFLVSSTDNVAVMAASGAVNVATGKTLNFEAASKYVFVVR